MRVFLLAWTAGLATTASAFYAYTPTWGDASTGNARRGPRPALSPSDQPALSLSLPLRRVPARRDNIYQIVASVDPGVENSVGIDQQGNGDGVGNDLSYMVAVTFGDSEKEYYLLLDSAASSTWVMGDACSSDACGTHSLLGKAESPSLEITSEPFKMIYGTGTVTGVVASDKVHLGPLSVDLTFGLATTVSDVFRAFPMDGILGIGTGTDKGGNAPSTRVDAPQVLELLKSSSVINAQVYGVHLSRGKDGLNDGELTFGAPNADRYDGDLNYVPVVDNKSGFWELQVDNVGVDGVEIGPTGKTAILDTGTSYIYMPEEDATALHDAIPGSKKSGETFTVPCDTKNVIWIEFGGQKYDISVADWIGGKQDDGNCKSNVVGHQTFEPYQWLVGDVFLKNVYTVFDLDKLRVGFGVKGAGEKSTSTASSSSSKPSSTVDSSVTGTTKETQTPKAQEASGTETGTAAASSPTGGVARTSPAFLLPSFVLLGIYLWCL